MRFNRIRPEMWDKCRPKLLGFVLRHGEGRVTRQALEWLSGLEGSALSADGTAVIAATADGKLVAVAAAAGFGRDASFVVVHSLHRGKGLGESLVRTLIDELGRFCCSVATDNPASLRMCFRAGLVAYELVSGPTGKPTLRLRGERERTPVRTRNFANRER